MIVAFFLFLTLAALFGFAAWARLKTAGSFGLVSVPFFGAGALSLALSGLFLLDMAAGTNLVRSDFEREVAKVKNENRQ
jgi:hypothetical protein